MSTRTCHPCCRSFLHTSCPHQDTDKGQVSKKLQTTQRLRSKACTYFRNPRASTCNQSPLGTLQVQLKHLGAIHCQIPGAANIPRSLQPSCKLRFAYRLHTLCSPRLRCIASDIRVTSPSFFLLLSIVGSAIVSSSLFLLSSRRASHPTLTYHGRRSTLDAEQNGS